MTTATRVPVTVDRSGAELDAEDAWRTVRRYGVWKVLKESAERFRYGEGFTSSRALGLQMALGVVPFTLALTGLAADIDNGQAAEVVARTAVALTPGGGSDEAMRSILDDDAKERVGEWALAIGLVFAFITMVTATAQIERGSNRIYGIRRDRPGRRKYLRAGALTLVLALPVAIGFLLLVAGGPLGRSLADVYEWSPGWLTAWRVLRWPVGLATTVLTISVLLDHAPRRRQPALSWLALGALVAVLLTVAASALLGLYVRMSGSFGEVYGPLAGLMALLLWCYLTAMALFFGVAVAAQMEALRAGEPTPTLPDPGPPPSADPSKDPD